MNRWLYILLWLLPLAAALLSLGTGRFEVDPATVVKILGSHIFPLEATWSPMEYKVVIDVRLPRIMLALLIGAGLSVSGAGFQALFANPLVSPDILGVAAGAGFGASLGILLFGNGYDTQLFALVSGLTAIGFIYVIGGSRKSMSVLMMVLAGVVTSA